MIFFSRDLGVDLGTSNVLIYQEGKGIVLREPSVVAVDKLTGKVLQVGSGARNMLGRTPGNVVAMRPLREGVISDYEMAEKMLAEFFRKIMRYSILKPRVIVSAGKIGHQIDLSPQDLIRLTGGQTADIVKQSET